MPSRASGSAENRDGKRRRTAAADQGAEGFDVECEVEREPQGIEGYEPRTLKLVESPLDDGVRSRTLDLHANAQSSGCRKNHGPDIGRSAARLELQGSG